MKIRICIQKIKSNLKSVRVNNAFRESMIQVNMQKSIAFIQTCNKQFKDVIKKTITFTIATKRIKSTAINF